MKKYKILIVEDRDGYIQSLKRCIQQYSNIIDIDALTIVKRFNEARDLILNGNKFDISILDYFLNDGKTCIELLKETGGSVASYGQIVLTTIDSDWSSKFHEMHSDALTKYLPLEKPFSSDAFAKLMNKIQERSIHTTSHDSQKLALNRGSSGEFTIDSSKIIFIIGAGSYSNYYVEGNSDTICYKNISGKLDDQIKLLEDDDRFLRVHNSYIVNITKVKGGLKDKRTTGWLSFDDKPIDINNTTYYARYSNKHENYSKLRKLTGLKKI